MSKVKKKMIYALLLVVTFLSVTTVNAAGKNIGVSDFSVKDKSGTITVEDPVITDNIVTSNITFNEVGDFVTFKLVLKNNENEKYKIESITDNNTNKNLTIDYTFSKDFINTGETSTVEIKLTYKNKLINQDKISLNDLTIKINLVNEDGKSENIIINPTTGDTILHYLVLLIIALTGLILSVNKKKIKGMKIGNLIIVLAIILTPFAIFAKEKYEVQIKFNDIDIIGEYETYNITIDPKNGDPAVTKQITYGEKIGVLPTNPTKDGYTFDKWVDNKGNTVTEDTTITGPISIEAKYNIVKYDITYNLDGGSVSGNPTKYTIEDTITLKNPSKQGYTFAGWTGTGIDTQTTSVTIPVGSTGERSYVAHYSASEDTAYTVIHKFAKLTEGYDIEEVTEHGTTGSTVPAPRKTRTGFVTPSVQNVTIAADGSASVTYIYERETYAFSITDRTYIDASSTEDGTYPYGTEITAKAVARPGYDFAWSDGETSLSRTFELESAKELAPVYTAKTNTPYKVIHRKQKVTLDGYVEADTQNLTGTTDSPITPAVNTYTGFVSPVTQTTTIDGNGSTVVTYDYDRETYSFSVTDRTYLDPTSTADGTYPYGKEITVEAATKPGYTFTKWSNNETSNPYTFTLEGTVSINPVFEANTNTPYKVIHQKQKIDGTYEVANTQILTGTTDAEVTPEVKTYEGFTSPEAETTTIKGDGTTVVTYNYTRNKYTLTIENPEYVEEDKSGEYYYEEEVTLKAIDRQGYDFAGWSNGETTKEITVTIGTENITVKPIYTNRTDTTYKIEHEYERLNGDYKIEEEVLTGETGKEVEAPLKPKTGFVSPSVQRVTITADGKAKVTYTYNRERYDFSVTNRTNLENESTANGRYPYETEIYLKAKEKVGYTFAWSDEETSLERTFELTGNTELSLVYIPNIYTVEFDPNTGVGDMASQEMSYDEKEALTKNTFTKVGYIFIGWNTERDGTGTSYEDEEEVENLVPTGTITLYAQWIINEYTVSFDTDGGSTIPSQTINYGGYATRPATDPTKTGCTFDDWYEDSNYQTLFDFANTPITSATTIYGRFTSNSYTVTFDTDGGSTVPSQTISYGGTATRPATDPTKTGYTFDNWYADSEYQTLYDFTSPITGPTTIYGKFDIDSFTVTAYGNEGSIEATTGWTGTGTSSTKEVDYNSSIGDLPNTSRSGYILTGWNTRTDGTGTNVTASTVVKVETSIYAQWVEAVATFDTGQNVNRKMKRLSGQTSATYSTENTTITSIEKASTKPDVSSFTSDNIVSSSSSIAPIYMWYDNGTIYWWSEDNNPNLSSISTYLFNNLTAVTSIDLSGIDTSDVTKMSYMFASCSSLTDLDLGDNFDTSNVTTMKDMFFYCTSLTSLDLGDNFDTSSVENMQEMFNRCLSLTSLDLGDKFDTSNVEKMDAMFTFCSSLANLDLEDNFDTSNVTSMYTMFSNCSSLTSLDLGDNFDTSSVDNMEEMFLNCSSLTSLDLGDKFDTSNLDETYYMFANCSSLTSLDLGDKFDTSNVTTMQNMFSGCSNLTTIYVTNSFVTTKVTSSINMFNGDTNLVGGAGTVYSSSHKDAAYAHIDGGTSNPGYFTARPGTTYTVTAYANGGSIEASTGWTGTGVSATKEVEQNTSVGNLPEASRSGYVLVGWNTKEDGTGTNVTTSTTVSSATSIYAQWIEAEATFDTGQNVNTKMKRLAGNSSTYYTNDTNITSILKSSTKPDISTMTSDNIVSTSNSPVPIYMWYDNGIIYWWSEDNTPSLNQFSTYLFGKLSKLTTIDLSDFDTSQVTTMDYMFYECSSLTSIDLGDNFDTSNVTLMHVMFSDCTSLTSLDLGDNFDTSNVTEMGNMFERCRSLTTLDLGDNFDTSQVTDMHEMFSGCSSLASLDLGDNFDTGNVKSMQDMFSSCSSLTSLDLEDNFDTSQVKNMIRMFSNCSRLTNLDFGEKFDTSNVTKMEGMFKGCTSLTELDLSSFDTSQVTNMVNMFYECTSLTTIYASSDFVTINVTSSGSMFENDTNLVGGAGTVFDSNHVDKAYAHIDGGTSNPGYFTARVISQYTVTFDTDGGSEVSSQTVSSGSTATRPTTDPEKTGYVFDDWYTTDQYTTKYDFTTPITGDTTIYAKFDELKTCAENENVTRLSENTCSANENITVGDGIVCKRAVKLHEETCSQTSNYCNASGYTPSGSKGTDTITYGSCGTSGTLTNGDAFTCDVNGDGDFDELTERFYYISDYYNTSTKEFDDSTAVLMYYNNVTNGVSCNKNTYAYDSNNDNWKGPRTLTLQLPTTSQWSNVSLKSTSRQILTHLNTTSTSGGALPEFDYSGYAARFITAQELNSACGISIGSLNNGELDSCNYVLENTKYAKAAVGNNGYWLESTYQDDNHVVWRTTTNNRYVFYDDASYSVNSGARPVIEVPKTAIAIGTQSKYTVSFDSDGGSAISDIEVNPGDSIDELPTPTKADSIFVGWFEDESDTDPVSEPYTPSGDITLIAKWNNIICKKATTLHTETCNQTDGSKYCSGDGYTNGDTITYGNIVSSDTYQGGDAFDCDVDGTGYNQRFYYLRTKDNKAVLISNKNFTAASKQADQNISFIYSQAHDQLPTTSDWGNLPVKFDGKPARLMTMEDLLTVTNSSSSSDITPIGSLKGYEFLFESSNFSGIGERSTQWLEEISSTERYRYRNDQYNLAQVEAGKENTSKNPVRPVIEVPLDLIEDAYIVKFDANGGTSDTYVKVQKGSTIGTLPTATKTGYYLNGWYTSLDYTIPVTENTIPVSFVTYYAKWVLPVTDAQLNTDNFIIQVGETNQIEVSNESDIEQYTFVSNNESIATVDTDGTITAVSTGTTTISMVGSKSGLSKTINVNVQAEVTDYVVSFDSQGGSPVNDMIVPKNTTLGTLPDTPTYEGYDFGGWYTNTNYSTEVTVDTLIISDVTFYALWIPTNAVAEINKTFYTTLQAAVDDAPTTKTTIILLKNVEVTSPIDMSNKNTDKDIILDLNGYTLSTGSSAPNKTNVIKTKAKLEVKNGTISSAKNDALIDVEGSTSYLVLREDINLISTGGRACVYNTGGNALIDGNASLTSNAEWTSSMKRGTVQTLTSGVTTIKGGTIINNRASSSYAVAIELGTVTIGTEDGIYDIQNLIMQGETNGIYALVDYSLYDGMIKGKTAAVNDESKITGIETGATKVNDTDSGYNRLYYTLPVSKYKVTLNANGGEVDPTYINVDAGDQVGTLPTPTRGLYTFDGWWTDYSGGTQVTSSYEPTENVEIIARWHYNSSTNLVSFNMNNNAIETYANYISSWKDLPQATFQANMMDNMNTNSCSKCDQPNSCNNPSAGNLCDQSIGYNTGVSSDLKVYTSDETTKAKGDLVTYTTSSNGVIYNMIPGETYYWEAADDSTIYGIVKANGYRRLIKSPVRNVRDLGGLAVDTDGDGTSDGRIKYGILFRGAQLSSNQSDATSLQKLGITRELDLRPNSEGKDKGQAVLPKYDIDTPGSEQDVIMHNYLISYSTHPDYYTELRNTIKTVMNYVVEDDDSIFFHCTIGTDRTGTLAYFLEGLLGVSEEDRLEDYELSYYFGMTNRDRYHDNLQNSSINPRFTTMYNTYNTNAKIYEWFMNENPNITQAEKDADEILLSRFRQKMIE